MSEKTKTCTIIETEEKEYDDFDRCRVYHFFHCSNCKNELDLYEPIRNYCPNCGARIVLTEKILI